MLRFSPICFGGGWLCQAFVDNLLHELFVQAGLAGCTRRADSVAHVAAFNLA